MVDELHKRLTAVRQQLAHWHVDALLLSSPANRRWLSGFTGSNGMLLISAEQALLATDSRYYEQAQAEAPAFQLFKHERTNADNLAFFQVVQGQRLGIEAVHTSVQQAFQFDALPLSITWMPLAQTVEPLRAIKSAAEQQLMQRAAAITDRAMALVPQLARPGMSEKALAWELEKRMREWGADELAFATIVASGPNAASPHHAPGERPLQIGDSLIIDMGAKLAGYHSDMTRTFHVGHTPSEQFWQVYNLVFAAHQAALSQIRPGMRVSQADALARDVIAAAGYGAYFGHGLGHGVGLEIHEQPFLSARAPENETLAQNMNITIEPGIYLPGWGGVRIEDFAHLGENGAERISLAPYEPIIPV